MSSHNCNPDMDRLFRSVLYDHLLTPSSYGLLHNLSPPHSTTLSKITNDRPNDATYQQAMDLLTSQSPGCPWYDSDLSLKDEPFKRYYGKTPSQSASKHHKMYVGPNTPVGSPPSSGSRLQGQGWACYKCGKRFKSLYWLDVHFCEKHKDEEEGGDEL
eukprot:CAMPEP_0118647460 /NCGR_PEP_ID=MMETSP0785-20121206/8618_1 /TAXON_ID=91992 /ORGANISM="Bolidomonas pacifica, Strain CCMP 1866" /LENGTH=157 /DNA_ID=CAMNT_0006539555 /DNA_START=272 /DNA_END=742 /DNA_ORIENTATION=-